jgi:hypothetical protein
VSQEKITRSCYDCEYCILETRYIFGSEHSSDTHLCIAPRPAWTYDCANNASAQIEDPMADQDQTMATNCDLFKQKQSKEYKLRLI